MQHKQGIQLCLQATFFQLSFENFRLCFGCDCYDSKLLKINTSHPLKAVS